MRALKYILLTVFLIIPTRLSYPTDADALYALYMENSARINAIADIPELSASEILAAAPEITRADTKICAADFLSKFSLAGIYVPIADICCVDTNAHPRALPFTCVHECIHSMFILDETETNIIAFRACLDAGGAWEYSARLWLNRYIECELSHMGIKITPMLTCAAQRDTEAMGAYSRPDAYSALARYLSVN